MYKLIILGAGIAAFAILAVGCGSSGSDQAAAQITEAQFLRQVDAICTKTHKEVGAAFFGRGTGAAGDPAEQISQLLKEEARELGALAGPEKVEAKIDPLTESISQASGVLAQGGKAALEDPQVAEYKKEAQVLHLPDC